MFGFGKPNVSKMYQRQDVDGLVKALSYQDDPKIPLEAAASLAQMGPAATSALGSALQSPAVEVRKLAVMALHRMKGSYGIRELAQALRDSDSQVRGLAVIGLGEKAGRDMVPQVTELLRLDPDAEVRSYAATALATMGRSSAIQPLLDALQYPGADVRIAAISELGALQDRQAEEPLIALLGDSDARVRAAAVIALANFCNYGIAAADKALSNFRLSVLGSGGEVRSLIVESVDYFGRKDKVKARELARCNRCGTPLHIAAGAMAAAVLARDRQQRYPEAGAYVCQKCGTVLCTQCSPLGSTCPYCGTYCH